MSEPISQPSSTSSEAVSKTAAWGEPVARFERKWTWFETRLITFVLIWQLVVLGSWVVLSGLSSPLGAGNAAGTVIRAAIGSLILGIAAWVATRKLDNTKRNLATGIAILVACLLAPKWRSVGVEYFDNVKGWLQEGSILTLAGGLRGLATRLTLWLALLGGSLATAAGKNIHIDVIFRFLPKKARLPAAIVNNLVAMMMCFTAVWGFFDHISINDPFNVKDEAPAKEKISHVLSELSGKHFFLVRKQVSLDFKTLPHVFRGERYDRWMTANEWNQWVRDANYESHYSAESIKNLIIPEDSPAHSPFIVSPDGETTRGLLEHDLRLVFPFGLFAIGLRFLLRAILTLSGHLPVDPDAAHRADTEELPSDAEKAGAA